MGRLTDFHAYLEDRRDATRRIGRLLGVLQTKYESFFSEVTRVREQELVQLTRHIVKDRDALPEDLDEALTDSAAAVDEQFEAQLARLEEQLKAQRGTAEDLRLKSMEAESELHGQNVELDDEEEALKTRTKELLAEIDEHNHRIREMGGGWGFFANIFKMRPLAARRVELMREHDDLAARIENLRSRWQDVDDESASDEAKLRELWLAEQTKVATLEAKRDHITETGPRIRLRSAVERVLFERRPKLPAAKTSDPPCSRCQTPNPKSLHFCHICAQRLVDDRPDLEGSLLEIAELNLHHERFAEGMQSCQEIMGLVKGLHSGIEAFMKSVSDMIDSENRYPLAKLQIDVPAACEKFGGHFDELERWVSDQSKLSVHPTVFAKTIEEHVMAAFTEENIMRYFETMGEELSTQADSQW